MKFNKFVIVLKDGTKMAQELPNATEHTMEVTDDSYVVKYDGNICCATNKSDCVGVFLK